MIRRGCFKYFELGGKCVEEPVSILAGILSSPGLLFYHFFSVALYTIYVLFTHPMMTTSTEKGTQFVRPSIARWPSLALFGTRVVCVLSPF
jgi:squalene monooxygenase